MATKFDKIFVVLLTRASCSVRATALCKKSTKIFMNKCGQIVLYKLYYFMVKRKIFKDKKRYVRVQGIYRVPDISLK